VGTHILVCVTHQLIDYEYLGSENTLFFVTPVLSFYVAPCRTRAFFFTSFIHETIQMKLLNQRTDFIPAPLWESLPVGRQGVGRVMYYNANLNNIVIICNKKIN